MSRKRERLLDKLTYRLTATNFDVNSSIQWFQPNCQQKT